MSGDLEAPGIDRYGSRTGIVEVITNLEARKQEVEGISTDGTGMFQSKVAG
jgi:hypothetical protein